MAWGMQRNTSRRWWPEGIVCLWVGLWAVAAASQTPSLPPRDAEALSGPVQRILEEHCIACHGAAKQSGELRLDGLEHVLRGGHSGSPVIASTPEESELFLRVSSDDPNYRMPRDAPPLDASQIESIRRWIAGGGFWPAATDSADAATQTSRDAGDRSTSPRSQNLLDRLDQATKPLRPLFLPLVICLIAVWWLERKRRRKNGRQPLRAPENATRSPLSVSRWSYLAVVAMFLLAGLWLRDRSQWSAARVQVEQLRRTLENAKSPAEPPPARSELGGPMPHRPKHPRRLGGVYYRGNDERDPRLFNGGFYRTAEMRVWLADADRRELRWGSQLDSGELWIGLEIQRAPSATPQLFTQRIMETVYLSRQFYSAQGLVAADKPVRLETIKPGDTWRAFYPLGDLLQAPQHRLSGVVYVYKSREAEKTTDAKFHFGIRYDIRAAGDLVSPESELWMGALALPFGVLPPRDEGLTHDEWFDFRPIPEIEGENTQDPGLLGIPEYAPAEPTADGGE